ncbi:MAG TPA: prolipoprotein diacylglyceryl transferase [Candidatus Sulfotelmatobacter sp.]|jgi:phosphatidylglycerol:prolipoprotein diacylglycerol transferase|nr:prolipoprotein diacylglyceryl transferase [Candidatus Sulfotelmatobacter sp.]
MAIAFPDIDPVAIKLGPLAIRWYALAYISGLLGGWGYLRRLIRKAPHAMTELQVDDFIVWATLGVVLGGRIGFVLFYKPSFYLENPIEIFSVWKGGMSFHGGALGVITAIILFSRRHGLNLFAVGDLICVAQPLGQLFGRIANFINGELFGRPTDGDLPWAMIFPTDELQVPRHPSQLYEAGLEGLALLIVLHLLWRVEAVRMKPGTLAGLFLAGYGLARIVCEFFREPDSYLGFLWGGATMGQLLSIPLVIVGISLAVFAQKRHQSPA